MVQLFSIQKHCVICFESLLIVNWNIRDCCVGLHHNGRRCADPRVSYSGTSAQKGFVFLFFFSFFKNQVMYLKGIFSPENYGAQAGDLNEELLGSDSILAFLCGIMVPVPLSQCCGADPSILKTDCRKCLSKFIFDSGSRFQNNFCSTGSATLFKVRTPSAILTLF